MNYPKPKNRVQKFFDNLNYNAAVPTFLISVVLLLLFFYGCAALMGCQKEHSFTKAAPVIESDHKLMPEGGYNLSKRDVTPELQMASKKANPGKGKGKPGTDTTGGGGEDPQDPPPSTGQGVILLDFDGQYVSGSYWNVNGPINAAYSGMTAQEIQTVVDSCTADYAEFGVIVTTDEAVYYAAPVNKRIRVIITESYEWYGTAGGVGYLGSFTWGTETPAWVFSSLLGYSAKNVWEAASHEAGHTLGLRHQAKWVNGVKVSDYHDGEGLPYAPIMGVGYYKWATWHVGLNSYGTLQDDRAIIRATLNQ